MEDAVIIAIYSTTVMLPWLDSLRQRRRSWALHRDPRARRELLMAWAGTLAGTSAAVSVATALILDTRTGMGMVFGALAWGSFVALGVIFRSESPPE